MQVNLVKSFISSGYIFFFFLYTRNIKDKRLAWTQVAYCGAFMAAVFVYAQFENRSVLKFRFGIIFTAVLFFFISIPFFKIVSGNSPSGNLVLCLWHNWITAKNHSHKKFGRIAIPNAVDSVNNHIFVVFIWSSNTWKDVHYSKGHFVFDERHSSFTLYHISSENYYIGERHRIDHKWANH